jgi:hypothetical protein
MNSYKQYASLEEASSAIGGQVMAILRGERTIAARSLKGSMRAFEQQASLLLTHDVGFSQLMMLLAADERHGRIPVPGLRPSDTLEDAVVRAVQNHITESHRDELRDMAFAAAEGSVISSIEKCLEAMAIIDVVHATWSMPTSASGQREDLALLRRDHGRGIPVYLERMILRGVKFLETAMNDEDLDWESAKARGCDRQQVGDLVQILLNLHALLMEDSARFCGIVRRELSAGPNSDTTS